jgi:acyl-CoA thioester hydrolase
MPHVHERAFVVRHYECDAYGHVNHANYLRYMQEAAYSASADAGYDMHRLFAMNRIWLIRETDITYHEPLVYGDTVVVKTYVQDFRRVRSRRAYELRKADSDALVATATTDWVFLDRKTHRPATIPDEITEAFFPEGPPASGQRRDRFPEPPAPPPGVFTMHRTVEWRDLDPAQHVNNSNYLAYLEEAGVRAAAAHGWPMQRLIAENIGVVARNYRIDYVQQALFGDALTVATWVSDVKRATAMRHYTIHRVADGALMARAQALWVWVFLDSGKPRRIPADFSADFAPNITT